MERQIRPAWSLAPFITFRALNPTHLLPRNFFIWLRFVPNAPHAINTITNEAIIFKDCSNFSRSLERTEEVVPEQQEFKRVAVKPLLASNGKEVHYTLF